MTQPDTEKSEYLNGLVTSNGAGLEGLAAQVFESLRGGMDTVRQLQGNLENLRKEQERVNNQIQVTVVQLQRAQAQMDLAADLLLKARKQDAN